MPPKRLLHEVTGSLACYNFLGLSVLACLGQRDCQPQMSAQLPCAAGLLGHDLQIPAVPCMVAWCCRNDLCYHNCRP